VLLSERCDVVVFVVFDVLVFVLAVVIADDVDVYCCGTCEIE